MQDHFVAHFKETVKGRELIAMLSFVSIFFSCLGLLGLASFTVERKTKEIAIRKVLGATVKGVTGMLLVKFLLLVVVSNMIALPFAWYVAHWFINWAWVDRIPLSADIFLFAVALSFGMAIAAVIIQTARAALSNPTAALRVE